MATRVSPRTGPPAGSTVEMRGALYRRSSNRLVSACCPLRLTVTRCTACATSVPVRTSSSLREMWSTPQNLAG